MHVRGDRRHIQESDVFLVQEGCKLPINFEMANTPEMLDLALRLKPRDVCLVPENRQEISTEGGLEVVGQLEELSPAVAAIQEAGIRVSMFIDPDPEQVEGSADLGAEIVELHTGCFANADGEAHSVELERLMKAAERAHELGLQVNAGHGINYQNISQLFFVPHLAELNIGHSIVSRAVSVGMKHAVHEMKHLMQEYKAKGA